MSNIRERLNKYIKDEEEKSNIQNRLNQYINEKQTNVISKKNNGYQFGDFTLGALSTIGDVATNVGKGFLSGTENIVDLGRYGVAGVADMLGADEYAEDVRKRAQQDTTSILTKPAEDVYNQRSVLKEDGIIEGVSQGIGQIGAIIGSSALLPSSLASVKLGKFNLPTTSIISGAGGGMTQAYNEGANDLQALGYGAVRGITEGGTEALFGGLGKTFNKVTGGGALDEFISKSVGKSLSNFLTKKGASSVANKVVTNLAQMGVMSAGEGLEEVISSALDPISKKIYSDKSLKELSKDQNLLQDFVVGALTSAIAQSPSTISNIRNNKQATQKTSNGTTLGELVQREQNNKNNVNLPISDNSGNIVNSNKFQYVKSDNSKIDNLRKSANQYFNNSVETQNLVNTIEKVIGDKNYDVVFDNSIKNKNGQSVNAQITTNKNGEIEIKINPNSSRAGEFLLTHEITHAIETDSMKNLVLNYASKNAEFNQALESLKQTYGVDDVSSEVISDISGQLLGNQEFINSLTMQNTAESKSIIKTIYENIKRLLNTLTKNGRYRNFVQDLEIKWRDAYKTTTTEQAVSNLNNETKYMMTGLKGMENGITTSAKYVDIKDRYDAALYLENKNYSNEKIRQITGWFKDKEGNWEFEISDQHTKFKIQPKTNAKYKLSDIFEANTLYEMYPELKNITVSFKNMKSNGKYFSVTNEISINNKLINSIDSMKGTLLHEIQHYIQKIEGLPEGTSLFFSNEQYANNKGEIEAADTKNRRNLNVEQRKLIIPESAKQNPIHPNRQNILNHKRSFIEKIGDKIYNRFGGESNEIFEEFNEKNQNQNIEIYDSNNRNRLKELDNSSFSLKEKQLDIILNNNPAGNDNVTWIRKIDDIKTFEETLQDEDWQGYDEFNPDYTLKMANEAVDSGKIIVYSSYPIEQGIFVTPSKMEAESYSGTGKVYSKEVSLKDVAWIDPTQGQYAKVDSTKYSNNNQNWQDYLEQNYKATGTRTDMRKLLPTQEDIKKMELSNIKLPIKEARKLNSQQKNNYVESKITKILNSQSYKAVNKASKVGQNYLYFNNTQKRNFKEKLMKYVGKSSNDLTNAKTWNEVKELVKEYANKDYIYVDEELKSAKNQVRSMNIKITDDLKRQITDYNDFRKENFGKLKLGNNGNTIDSIYQELSEQYPYYFGSAETQADMLYELSDFMNKDINIVEKYQFDDAYLEETTAKIFNNLMQNTLNEQQIEELRTNLEDKLNARTREVIQEELMQEMGITLDDISKGKDISSFDLSRTDPIRVNEKIFGAKVGDKINDATIRKTQANEASRIRFLNKERNEIKKLGIKAFSKESEAVQKYGEKQYINDKGDIIPYGDKELIQDFPDIITQQKIKKAAEVIRNKYDTYIDQINNVLVDMGYDAIKKRKDYMRHFQALNDVFSRFGVPLNAESLQSDSLPTDINGLTDQFKPGKQYFASAMQRIGMRTAYDAITGIDGYLEGASNLIYHTEDIQRYRALSKFIRNTYGTEHGFENVDKLTLPQQEQRIQDIQSNKLAKYVSWLDEQANALANKKGKIDRGVEEVFGRKVYQVLETAKKQVGSNMVGFNVRSALTNFASVVQGSSKTNKIAFLKGTISTINNMIHKDNLVDKSDFLTRRFGSDQLSQKLWQKATNAGFALMTGTDYFTANQIWRSKYYEYLDNGLSENMAIKGADDFASRIMGDRSKGSTATLFNSKTLGFFTQFQLEVNNQWSTMIHDNKMDLQRGNKTASSIVFQLGQLFAMSYLFNNLMESCTGSDVMLDPIELLKMLFNPDDEEDMEQRATKVLGEVVNNIPFASIFTGGRIPVGEAFGGVSTAFKYATGQTDDYGNNYEVKDVANDMIESAFYWILPTGFSQLNKTRKGLSMYDENLPVKGSYTESGNLRFTADESFGGKVKATLFGQYSSKESQDYIESGFKTIPKGKINEMKSLEMNSTEYRKYREELANAGKTNEEKLDYISGLKLPISKKNIMANNVVNSDKYQIDMSKYGDFSSYEEMQMYYTNPAKYQTITQISSYKNYNNYQSEINTIKERYSNTNDKKNAIIKYVNDLILTIPQKAMLIKMNYNSFKDYDNQIIEYINSQNMTIAEKTTILEQLGFTVRNGRVYS